MNAFLPVAGAKRLEIWRVDSNAARASQQYCPGMVATALSPMVPSLSPSAVVDYLACNHHAWLSWDSSASCYASHDSLIVAWGLCVYFAAYSFVWSIVGQNCSKVDQIWSITPVVYVWHFFLHHYLTHSVVHARLLLLAALVTVWGVRLTYNFWKKGGYGNFITHEEDYRWPIIRAKMHPALFLVFNFSFIACYQNVLLLFIALPAYEVYEATGVIAGRDIVLAGAFLALWLMETVADQQHWVFQSHKHSLTAQQRAAASDQDIRRGFFTQGLFRLSRHPNYFAEQAMWVVVFFFGCGPASSPFSLQLLEWWPQLAAWLAPPLNWTALGCLQLVLLFQGSMRFGESITVSKYPDYRAYQATTSQCLPWVPARSVATKRE